MENDEVYRARVLLVDDHPVVRKVLKEILADCSFLEIIGEAGDGREAVDIAKLLNPDIIVMDWEMPVMDGLEAGHLIQTSMPKTQILILTVFANQDDCAASREYLGLTVLSKDAGLNVLVKTLEKMAANNSQGLALKIFETKREGKS